MCILVFSQNDGPVSETSGTRGKKASYCCALYFIVCLFQAVPHPTRTAPQRIYREVRRLAKIKINLIGCFPSGLFDWILL